MKGYLTCINCGKKFDIYKYVNQCDECGNIVRSFYNTKLHAEKDLKGIWKFKDWMPVKKIPKIFQDFPAGYLIYKSDKISKFMGLKKLYIAYSGTYTNEGIKYNITGTFKDIEAQGVIARWISSSDTDNKVVVISSDGNFASSFLYYAGILGIKTILVTTKDALENRICKFEGGKYDFKNLMIISISDGDYFDAIELSSKLCSHNDRLVLEGGAKNVGRRDAVGTIILEFLYKFSSIPNHYFQATGSGVGVVAVYDTLWRLIKSGLISSHNLTSIHPVQNAPFDPIRRAWRKMSREIPEDFTDFETSLKFQRSVLAHVLTNRRPFYSQKGGIYDILKETNGDTFSVTNEEIKYWTQKFNELEEYQTTYEGGVSIAGVWKAFEERKIEPSDMILVHITAGNSILKCGRFDKFVSVNRNILNNESEITELIKFIANHFRIQEE